jgi:hypothetical protein
MQTDPKKLRTESGRRRLAPMFAALALGLALPMVAQAAEAMRVVRDPVTGELRAPTAAELATMKQAEAQLRAKSLRSATAVAAPAEIVHPDGTVELPLGEDSHMASVVRLNDDGTLSSACMPAKQAQAWVQSGGKSTTAAKRDGRKSTVKGHEGHNHD